MSARIERIPLPDLAQLRRALAERVESVCAGAALVDADAQGPTGVDIILADEDGRPVFVDVVSDGVTGVPSRVFEHTHWFDRNRQLFLRAYSGDGIVRTEDPVFVFVASRFPAHVLDAVAALAGVSIRLLRAEYFLVDGSYEMLLDDVTPGKAETVSTSVARRTDDMGGGSDLDPSDRIESEAVRALLALFRSGVDGLDGRIRVLESDDRIAFRIGDRRLAEVTVSPGSFTVSPGDGLSNPIVVSDRISLERALNAVVSLFVREGGTASGGNGGDEAVELDDKERSELARIWGGGVAQADAR
jgi:hypothetical protein